MNLNILVRGQSNAILFVEWPNWIGWSTLEGEVERLLGFDGATNDVSLVYERYDTSAATAYSATAFIGEWLAPKPGGWQGGWTVAEYEQGLLNHIGRLAPSVRDDPTAVLWLHSEYDSRRRDLTAEEWTSAVRHDMGLVRAALGQPDAPYHFVSAQPYSGGSNEGHQAIRLGMERLAADPAARAHVAARTNDLDMAGDGWFGSSHLDSGDAVQIALRAARSIAEDWAEHARPGSPVALAGGDLADEGPRASAARQTGPRTVEVDVAHDRASGFAALDADAAAGVGWGVRAAGGGGWTDATAAALVDADTLRLTFGADLPAGGLLFYGWGYGRLEGADGSGRGNAVYDNQGLPVWVPAAGIALAAGEPPPPPGTGTERPEALDGTSGPDRLAGLGGDDTLRGLEGADTLDGGAGADLMLGGAGDDTYLVDSSGDRTVERKGEGAADLVVAAGAGLSWTLGDHVERLRLSGEAAADGTGNGLANRLEGNGAANRLAGGAGDDTLEGGGGADTLDGGTGKDSLTGGEGEDLLIGGVGADRFEGGAGADRFRLAGPRDGVDILADMTAGLDRIQLSAGLLGGGLREGTDLSAPGRFVANRSGRADAPGGTGQVVYETDVGRLWWDADGAGGASAVALARLPGLPALGASDFEVVA